MEAERFSADLVGWSGQVENEVQRVAFRVEGTSGVLSSRFDDLSGSVSSVRDAVATCSSQWFHLEIALQQLGDNHAAKSNASRDVGDVRERLM